MALNNKVTIWSAQVLVKLRAAIVFGAPSVTNRDYQGDIANQGDRVTVTGVADPTIFDVPRNADIPDPETLTDEERELVIDQSKGFNFQVDDLDKIQVAQGGTIQLRSALNAGRRLAETADGFLGAKMGAEAGSTIGSNSSPVQVDAPQPGIAPQTGAIDTYRVLVMLGVKLDKENVPEEGRFVVLPSFMMGALALDPRFTGNPQSGQDTLRNGFQGRAARLDVYTTTAVPEPQSGKYQVIAGHPMATAYAEQLVTVEQYRPPGRFADAMKGQHVYGGKTFYPECLAMATVQDVSGLDA